MGDGVKRIRDDSGVRQHIEECGEQAERRRTRLQRLRRLTVRRPASDSSGGIGPLRLRPQATGSD